MQKFRSGDHKVVSGGTSVTFPATRRRLKHRRWETLKVKKVALKLAACRRLPPPHWGTQLGNQIRLTPPESPFCRAVPIDGISTAIAGYVPSGDVSATS